MHQHLCGDARATISVRNLSKSEMILGLVSPTAGTATIAGRPLAEHDEPARVVGAVLDGGAFNPGRTARKTLQIAALAARVAQPRIDEVLAEVGLTRAGDKKVGAYSLGMRQRLALAQSMLADAAVLIADEPANGLDPGGINWLRGLLRERADEGTTVLLCSHWSVGQLIHAALGNLMLDITLGVAGVGIGGLTQNPSAAGSVTGLLWLGLSDLAASFRPSFATTASSPIRRRSRNRADNTTTASALPSPSWA